MKTVALNCQLTISDLTRLRKGANDVRNSKSTRVTEWRFWNTHKVPKVCYKSYISSKNAHYPSIHCEKTILSRSNFLKCGLTLVREGNSFKLQPWGKFYSWQVLPFGLFVCLFILKGEEEEVVYRNQRFKGTIETTASVVKRELIAIPYFLRFPVWKLRRSF